jgi:hypothetical protein
MTGTASSAALLNYTKTQGMSFLRADVGALVHHHGAMTGIR